ncbi:hypothetical protein HAZT_HAZT007995 [Hyalella azteca]|uniref:Ig-like domain-containing protein n=1 Tax=Hyalella azteca TaxID=294128 RepID=A0A6A0HEM8_HYAAZ|nr:hypothetical protein HAZT_HAZT007995 [Hyalella azteca]
MGLGCGGGTRMSGVVVLGAGVWGDQDERCGGVRGWGGGDQDELCGGVREVDEWLHSIKKFKIHLPMKFESITDTFPRLHLQVAWTHIDRQILLTIDNSTVTLIPRFFVRRTDERTWTLHIRSVQPDDTGYYVCQVNMEPMINQVGFLQVVVPPLLLELFLRKYVWHAVPPQFVDARSSPSHVSVKEGAEVTLACAAKGEPEPSVAWSREDRKPITRSRHDSAGGCCILTLRRLGGCGWGNTYSNVIITVGVFLIPAEESPGVGEATLVIAKASRNDMGAYLCIASNKVPPSISRRIVLDVHFEPLITVPNQLVGAPLGTSITLECRVTAFPKAVHYWRFGDNLLINSSRQITREITKGYTTNMLLTIHQLNKQDFGIYVCGSKNSLGDTDNTLQLYGE